MGTTLVTGGAGFIGSHLVEALLARGETVRVLDDLSTGRRANLAHLADRATLVEGDIRDEATVRAAMQGVDHVHHLAAVASVPLSMEQPVLVDSVNVQGTLRVLEGARAAGVKRVVFSASCAAYGDAPQLPSVEDQPVAPLSPYAVSKIVGELYAGVYTRMLGVPTVALRYFNVFGPRQDPHGPYAAVVPLFAEAMLAGRRPTILGTGEQSRDFVYVANVVHANLLAREAPDAPGRVFNVGSGERVSLLRLVDELNAVLGTAISPEHRPPRAGDILHSAADLTRTERELGYRPIVSFREGLARTVEWYRTSTR